MTGRDVVKTAFDLKESERIPITRRKIMSQLTLDTVRDAFTSMCQQFQKSVEQGDAESIGTLYGDDAKVLPPNMEMIEGKDTIQKFWQMQEEYLWQLQEVRELEGQVQLH